MDKKLVELGPEGMLAHAFQKVLEALEVGYGLDLTDPNFEDTPMRIARAYGEVFSGLKDTDMQLKHVLATSFPCEGNDGMIIMRDIQVFSVCPHHLLPTLMTVSLAYIPSKGGRVLGLSKLARVAEILSKRPVLQEKYTCDLTNALMSIEGCLGAAALVEGKHCCMMIRGISKIDAVTITSSMQGAFAEEDVTRSEFLSLVRRR